MWRFDNYVYIENIFKDKQFKLTTQRRTVLQILIENTEKKLSAEDVYAILQNKESGIGLATVYRTLELLEGLALLEKKMAEDGRSRYEMRKERDIDDIAQLLCVSCGKKIDFISAQMSDVHDVVARKTNFSVVHRQTKIYGYCNECQ